MKSKRPEKVLLPADPKVPAAAPQPVHVPMSNGASPPVSPREARGRAVAKAAARWRPKANILETAAASGRFETLGRALQASGLDAMLSEEGTFTVFAPTDKAFAKMPSADLASLLADKVRLRQVLTYHVVPQKVRAPRVGAPLAATTVDGGELTLTVEGGGYRVEEARIVKTNLRASNGVIHAIDTVLTPR